MHQGKIQSVLNSATIYKNSRHFFFFSSLFFPFLLLTSWNSRNYFTRYTTKFHTLLLQPYLYQTLHRSEDDHLRIRSRQHCQDGETDGVMSHDLDSSAAAITTTTEPTETMCLVHPYQPQQQPWLLHQRAPTKSPPSLYPAPPFSNALNPPLVRIAPIQNPITLYTKSKGPSVIHPAHSHRRRSTNDYPSHMSLVVYNHLACHPMILPTLLTKTTTTAMKTL